MYFNDSEEDEKTATQVSGSYGTVQVPSNFNDSEEDEKTATCKLL